MKMANEIKQDCNKCIHGYFVDFDHSGWHMMCGAYHCYLCHRKKGGECEDYKEGKPPEDKELLCWEDE